MGSGGAVRATAALNGLFFTFYQLSGTIGAVLSSLVQLYSGGGSSSRLILFGLLGAELGQGCRRWRLGPMSG